MSSNTITATLHDENILVITLAGSLSVDAIPEIQATLQKASSEQLPFPHLIMDMSEINYLDPAMLGLLVEVHSQYEKANAYFAIGGMTDEVRTLLELMQVHTIIDLYPNIDTAKAYIIGSLG